MIRMRRRRTLVAMTTRKKNGAGPQSSEAELEAVLAAHLRPLVFAHGFSDDACAALELIRDGLALLYRAPGYEETVERVRRMHAARGALEEWPGIELEIRKAARNVSVATTEETVQHCLSVFIARVQKIPGVSIGDANEVLDALRRYRDEPKKGTDQLSALGVVTRILTSKTKPESLLRRARRRRQKK